MGGAGPYIDLTPEDLPKWAKSLGIPHVSLDELEAAYARAREFILDKKKLMESDFGWTAEDATTDLFRINGPAGEHFALPMQFGPLLDVTQKPDWMRELSIASRLFHAKRPYYTLDTYIEGPAPLCDILHLLQIIAPRILIVVRVDDYDDRGEEYTARALPSKTWMEANKTVLEHVLGSPERYREICGSTGIQREMLSSYDDNPDPNDYYTTCAGIVVPVNIDSVLPIRNGRNKA
ncbi:hypothetical protein EWM64_g8844 [Hericium alpestre]|uniref:Uncharacterized protein n=1 Tax=Hericium alpestre TaxID=135208 RepID=A0A4Y9ZM57_9AGAM|nr:hypothetical protein EWM64_g8844 [Hericium alpestre]